MYLTPYGFKNIITMSWTVVSHKYCKVVQRANGYGYLFNQDSKQSRVKGIALQSALSLPGMNAEVSRAL
jgi:hypothetical protein